MLTQCIDVAFRDAPLPPLWMIEEHNDVCFMVKDVTGQTLGYFEDEPSRQSADARRMAANVAQLPTNCGRIE